MKSYIKLLLAYIILGIIVVLMFFFFSTYSHADIAITVATVLGLALTAIGTTVGIIAIDKSHESAMLNYSLAVKMNESKNSHEFYENILVPLQHLGNDIKLFGDTLFYSSKDKDANGNFIIPIIPDNMYKHANIFYAKLNMLVLYVDSSVYRDIMNKAKILADDVNNIIDCYEKSRMWVSDDTARLVKARNNSDELYATLVNILHIQK